MKIQFVRLYHSSTNLQCLSLYNPVLRKGQIPKALRYKVLFFPEMEAKINELIDRNTYGKDISTWQAEAWKNSLHDTHSNTGPTCNVLTNHQMSLCALQSSRQGVVPRENKPSNRKKKSWSSFCAETFLPFCLLWSYLVNSTCSRRNMLCDTNKLLAFSTVCVKHVLLVCWPVLNFKAIGAVCRGAGR